MTMIVAPLRPPRPDLDSGELFRDGVGDRLQALRTERRLERREIAAAVGISYVTLRLYELGERDIPLITAQRIASVLAVPITKLLP